MTLRLLAVIAALVGVILFVVCAISTTVNPSLPDWGFVCIAAAIGFVALEGLPLRA
jgi:hypothetical protein